MDLSKFPEKLYYSISEISNHFGVSQSLIRYWESEFPSIKPKRNKKGTRFFTKSDIDQIAMIYHLVKEKGYTLNGAKDRLKSDKQGLHKELQTIELLKNIKTFLQDIQSKL